MEKIKFQRLLFKYSILLSISYLLSSVWFHITPFYYKTVMETQMIKELLYWIPTIFRYFINLILAILIYRDLKDNEIKNFLTVIITFLFGFIGIGLFFIQLFYVLRIRNTSNNGLLS